MSEREKGRERDEEEMRKKRRACRPPTHTHDTHKTHTRQNPVSLPYTQNKHRKSRRTPAQANPVSPSAGMSLRLKGRSEPLELSSEEVRAALQYSGTPGGFNFGHSS